MKNEPVRKIPADFDLEKELTQNPHQDVRATKIVSEHLVEPGFSESVLAELLERLNICISPLRATQRIIVQSSRTAELHDARHYLGNLKIGLPTLDILAGLPDNLFGQSERCLPPGPVMIPYSLARVDDDIYFRRHMSDMRYRHLWIAAR